MTSTPDETIRALRENYEAQRQAMVAGDADALATLLTEDFVLVHMTGYEQSRDEWLDDVSTGRMRYHRISDVTVAVELDDNATLVARTTTDATIWGASGSWALQLRISYAPVGDGWIATHTIASTWR